MRLLISGSKRNPNTVASFFIREFNGDFIYEVLAFPDRFSELLESKVYRLINRLFPALLIWKMDKLFVEQIESFRPTVILIFKGMEISKRSLKLARDKGIKLANFNFDHPYDFFSRGTGNRFVKEAIPYYDLHISYSSLIAAELRAKFHVSAAWIPFGFHITAEQYDLVVRENRPEIKRLCFVGNPDNLRVQILGELMNKGLPVDVYGFNWEKHFQSNELLTIYSPMRPNTFWADPLEFWKVLRQYRVQLNFFRPHNEGSHNLRTFEVPAVGGILLTPESAEQKMFFEDGQEIFFYSGFDSLLEQCRILMSADAKWIRNIRQNARNKSISKDYSYGRRTRDLIHLLEGLHINNS